MEPSSFSLTTPIAVSMDGTSMRTTAMSPGTMEKRLRTMGLYQYLGSTSAVGYDTGEPVYSARSMR